LNHTHRLETIAPGRALAEQFDQFCEVLTADQQALARDVVSRVSGRWPMWILHVLLEADHPLRFSRVMERVEGISQKMLTQALRQLERDGLITRTLYPQVPPRVDYALTPMGLGFLEQILPLWRWMTSQVEAVEAARRRFDADAA
jgi:DNA-binding HxlR family transcriptional regulator